MCMSLLKWQQQFLCPWISPLALRSPLPSNMGISYSRIVVRFASLCVAHKVSVYVCIVLCMGSPLGWGVECGWSIIVKCCSLYVGFASSALGVGGWVADFKVENLSWSCWNGSSNSAKGQWVSVSSLYLSDESLSHLGIVWSGSTRSRCEGTEWLMGAEWMWMLILFLMILCFIPRQLIFSLYSGAVITRTWFRL